MEKGTVVEQLQVWLNPGLIGLAFFFLRSSYRDITTQLKDLNARIGASENSLARTQGTLESQARQLDSARDGLRESIGYVDKKADKAHERLDRLADKGNAK